MQAPEQSNEEEAIEIERKRLEKLHEEPVRRYVLLFTFGVCRLVRWLVIAGVQPV